LGNRAELLAVRISYLPFDVNGLLAIDGNTSLKEATRAELETRGVLEKRGASAYSIRCAVSVLDTRDATLGAPVTDILTYTGAFGLVILSNTGMLAMGSDTPKYDQHDDISMIGRRETITSDIALRLAEMVFTRVYGQKYVEERLPFVIEDLGDRWQISSREGVPRRLLMVVLKYNGRILKLVDLA
jgi:hypothetical protein